MPPTAPKSTSGSTSQVDTLVYSTNNRHHEDHRDPQALPSVDLFSTSPPSAILTSGRSKPLSNKCPLCRRSAFGKAPPCHIDSLIHLRLRLRLIDLAYSVFNFKRCPEEESDRKELKSFFDRRHNDSLALCEREVPLSTPACQKIFKQAREILRNQVHLYMREHRLAAAEQLRMTQLCMFYEYFTLRDTHIWYFFDPSPSYFGHEWKANFSSKDIKAMYEDPKAFFATCKIREKAKDKDPKPSIDKDSDVEMEDLIESWEDPSSAV